MMSVPNILRMSLIVVLLLCSGARAMACLPDASTASNPDMAWVHDANDCQPNHEPSDTNGGATIEDAGDADDFIAYDLHTALRNADSVPVMRDTHLRQQNAPPVQLPPPNQG